MSTGSGTLTDNETCSSYYNLSLGEDPFYFRTTSTIKRLHLNAIRFGKTSDISVFYRNDTTQAEKNEYVVGLTTTSIVIFVFITTWFVLILLCMCLGPDRVGFFSGRQRKAGRGSAVNDDNIGKDNASNQLENSDIVNEQNDAGLGGPNGGVTGEIMDDEGGVTKNTDRASHERESAVVNNEDSNVETRALISEGQEGGEVVNEESDPKTIDPASEGPYAASPDVGAESIVDEKNESAENVICKESVADEKVQKSLSNSLSVSNIENDELAKLYRTRLVRARIVVLLCSVGIVISVILVIVFGVQNLVQSSRNVISGVEEGQELTEEAVVLVDNFLSRQKMALEVLTPFVEEINGICPNVTNQICEDITDSKTCNFTGVPLSEEFQSVFEFLIDNGKGIALDKADSLRDDLNELNEELGKVSDQISSFNWAFAVATVFAVLLLIADLVISHGIIVEWRRESAPPKYECCSKVLKLARHWLMVPFFVFLVVMSWIFSMVFILGGIATADLCYGSPDTTVLAILEKDVLPLDSTVRDLLIFYVEGCPEDGAPDDLSNKVNSILNYAEEVSNVADTLRDEVFIESFIETCGNNTSILDASAVAVKQTICNVGITLAEVALFFSCPNWRPLYRVVAYDAVCTNGTDGLYFVAITQFCVVAFAMIMVTLRFAFKPEVNSVQTIEDLAVQVPKDDNDDNRSNDALIRNSDKASPHASDGQLKLDTKDTRIPAEIRNE